MCVCVCVRERERELPAKEAIWGRGSRVGRLIWRVCDGEWEEERGWLSADGEGGLPMAEEPFRMRDGAGAGVGTIGGGNEGDGTGGGRDGTGP